MIMKIYNSVLLFFSVFCLGCSGDDDNPQNQNQAPDDFDLIGVTNTASNVSVTPSFSWRVSEDPDGDDVVYDFYISEDETASTLFSSDLSTTQFEIEDRLKLLTEYYWRVVAKDGKGGETSSEIYNFTTRDLNSGTQLNTSGFPNVFGHTSLAFDEKLWIIGGQGNASLNEQIINSTDGVNWNVVTSNPDFPLRTSHSSVVFDNKMWVLGGLDGQTFNPINDVWSSSDGINWIEETSSANPFPTRQEHTSVVYDNKIWVIGGREGSVFSTKNDVWFSTDGINWVEATAAANFSPRRNHTSLVFDNKIWVIGGRSGSIRFNDVWFSSDGINWVEATSNAQFSTRSRHTSIVYDNRIWLFGGLGAVFLNDIWSSVDGINWELGASNSNMSGVVSHSSNEFFDEIFILGGSTSSISALDQVWVFD